MRAETFASLSLLPKLDTANARNAATRCKICDSAAQFFDVVDFNKCAGNSYPFGPSGVTVQWFRCGRCGFLFTFFFDDWNSDEFSKFVYNDDYVCVDPEYSGPRPARMLADIPTLLGPPSGLRILDYGAGTGAFVDGLREQGYQASGYDVFSSPARPEGVFDLITCFEVIEHAPDPLGVLRDMRSLLNESGGILLGESLQPANIDELRCSWWYCAPRNGHCSTFTARSLAFAAERVGLRFHPGDGRHAFTSPRGGRVAQLLGQITGPSVSSYTLGAPGAALAPGWHHLEQASTGPFRWTSRASVTWQSLVQESDAYEWQIPVVNVVHRDFIEQCRIFVDGREAETQVGGIGLVVRIVGIKPVAGKVSVELRTPQPQSPRELRGVADDRRLGLAIGVL